MDRPATLTDHQECVVAQEVGHTPGQVVQRRSWHAGHPKRGQVPRQHPLDLREPRHRREPCLGRFGDRVEERPAHVLHEQPAGRGVCGDQRRHDPRVQVGQQAGDRDLVRERHGDLLRPQPTPVGVDRQQGGTRPRADLPHVASAAQAGDREPLVDPRRPSRRTNLGRTRVAGDRAPGPARRRRSRGPWASRGAPGPPAVPSARPPGVDRRGAPPRTGGPRGRRRGCPSTHHVGRSPRPPAVRRPRARGRPGTAPRRVPRPATGADRRAGTPASSHRRGPGRRRRRGGGWRGDSGWTWRDATTRGPSATSHHGTSPGLARNSNVLPVPDVMTSASPSGRPCCVLAGASRTEPHRGSLGGPAQRPAARPWGAAPPAVPCPARVGKVSRSRVP